MIGKVVEVVVMTDMQSHCYRFDSTRQRVAPLDRGVVRIVMYRWGRTRLHQYGLGVHGR